MSYISIRKQKREAPLAILITRTLNGWVINRGDTYSPFGVVATDIESVLSYTKIEIEEQEDTMKGQEDA